MNEQDKLLLLEAENKKLMQELTRLNDKLEESERFKSHFISNITNEIINPFTAILGISQSIMKLDERDIGQIHSMANLIFHEAFDLNFQLNNIFEAAKIEAGLVDMEVSRVNLVELLQEVLESFRFKAEKKALYFERSEDMPAELWINTDVAKMRTILSNLVDNSIKYSKEKNKVQLGLEELNGIVRISLLNSSGHLSNEDIERMLDRFVKLNQEIHSFNQGHGLGLSIVGAYLDLLEGRIQIVSPGKSTRITVEVPELRVGSGMYEQETDFFDDDIEMF